MSFLGNLGSALAGAASSNPLGFISSGLGIVDGVAGMFGQSSDQRFALGQMEWQSQEAQKQRDFQLDMWNRNNEYNKPDEQMKRLEEAGINPWQSMGNSSVASGNSSLSQPSGFVPSPAHAASSSLSPLGLAADVLGKIAQANKAGADTNRVNTLLQTELEKLIAEKNFVSLQAARQAIENSNLPHIMKKQLDKLTTEIELNKIGKEEVQERINEIISRSNLNNQQAALVYKYGERIQESIIAKNNADANRSNEEAKDLRETRADRKAALQASARYQNASAAEREMLNEIVDIDVNTIKEHGLTYIEGIKNKLNYTNYFNKNQKELFDNQLDLLKKQILIAEKTGDWYGVSILLGGVKDLATAGAILAK
nr:unnamed protein product [uncultured bacterium]